MTDFTLRPLTVPERKYTYAQSSQLQGQTGNIGYLRGDFGSSGDQFYTTWFDMFFDFDKNGRKTGTTFAYLSATPEPVVTPKRGLQKSHQQMTLKIKKFTNIVKLFLTCLSYGDILCLTIFIK